ncbi:MAG: type II secretion system protein [Planctomycetota bacterium]
MLSIRHRGFTLIELVAVIVVLAILAGVALPRYLDQSATAQREADEASIDGIRTALKLAYVDHRSTDAPPSAWITTLEQVPAIMFTGDWPEGIERSGRVLFDRSGNKYGLVPETATSAAELEQATRLP